jgi:hypothetical protein
LEFRVSEEFQISSGREFWRKPYMINVHVTTSDLCCWNRQNNSAQGCCISIRVGKSWIAPEKNILKINLCRMCAWNFWNSSFDQSLRLGPYRSIHDPQGLQQVRIKRTKDVGKVQNSVGCYKVEIQSFMIETLKLKKWNWNFVV